MSTPKRAVVGSSTYWRTLMLNAIKWAASPESKTWAKANAKRIFA